MTELNSVANNCFVCGPHNPVGLKLRFRLDGDDVCRSEFTPGEHHCGWNGVTHGGILFSLLDDVMANLLWLRNEPCFTARCEVRYREALPVGTPVRLEGRLLRRRARVADVSGAVIRADTGAIVVESTARFMLVDPATVLPSGPT